MLDKKEKLVMLYLCEVCPNKRSYLISASKIAEYVSKKFILSIAELDDIMISLAKENYFDVVVSDGRKGYFYCVAMKNKGLTFKKDLAKEKKEVGILLVRTICVTILSFVVGLLLKTIFGG
ncbi:MAG: hypothetical protein IKT27_05340 [Clostridia bacterium]|nr:hypothetical protein [Clostridia bacterium]